MGTQELDWIAVANNLLGQCQIDLRVGDLRHCDARVFVALYVAILGEEVPDFIAPPRNQEDDAHNVQSVIDSLALDYLQVSLSHITGENIVRGDTESIRNLLEIFHGLLEYLTEQISDASSQNGDDGDHKDVRDQYEGQKDALPPLRPPPSQGSSEPMVPAWEVDGSESTSELIRLGETAHTFTQRGLVIEGLRPKENQTVTSEAGANTGTPRSVTPPPRLPTLPVAGHTTHRDVSVNGFSLREQNQAVTPSAILLRPPYQPKDSRPATISPDIQVSETAGSPVRSRGPITAARGAAERSGTSTEDVSCEKSPESSHPTSPERRSPEHTVHGPSTEGSSQLGQKKVAFRTQPDIRFMTLQRTLGDQGEWTAPSDGGESDQDPALDSGFSLLKSGSSQLGQKKVAFRTQPDIRFMTLQRTLGDQGEWTAPSDGGESDQDPALDSGFSLLNSRTPDRSLADEPLSVQRARNKLSEMELQEMSVKLSRRLDELDQMLKKALGERARSSEPKDEDKLSQHSDSIMEFHRKKRLQAARNHKKPPTRPRSLSSSPVPLPTPRQLPCAQFEDALHKEARGELGKIRREVQKELDLQRLKAQMLNEAYKEELKDYEKSEKVKLSKLKENVKQKDLEHKENLFRGPEKRSHPEKVYSGKQGRPASRPRHGWCRCLHAQPLLSPAVRIKENDLLPLLLEEFPHLQISPHTFNAMWKGQLAQVEQLARSGQEDERSERKLQREVEDAHKRHDLLTVIIRREQGHNQRLKDFKERIRMQKMSQNKMKENRQQAARAKKYYEDYHVQLRGKMMRARTREERILKNLFDDGLEIQKQRLRELRSYTKEQREEQRKRHQDELESMENYYKDQFSMLAEVVTQEKNEMQVHEKTQSKNLHKIKKELRLKMEKEIRELQEMITRADEDAFFRELEAERLKRRLHMASFQYSKSH
ncbi:PREDICTED: centrosomal protein of 95 kDa [Nanorana parkeri]|uniref:centrosomal protein of 95 kDa n=1 Tax=Nanorana parkeri TaxID=125878 RepID=UPI000854B274|nr:PREDICTED: centrosomal protein of 95 kDa [Nanorana parkeri]